MRTRRRNLGIKRPTVRIDRATSRLIGLLASPDAADRDDAVAALARLGAAAVAPLCYRLLKRKRSDVAFRLAALRALGTVGAADWPTALMTLGAVPESHRDPETVTVMRETFVRILITVRQGRPATDAEVEAALRGLAAAARSAS